MSSYPDVRLRRFRRTAPLRALLRETRLSLDQFVMPLFVAPESLRNEELPGMSRYAVDDLLRETEELVRAGVQAVILFGIPEEKDEQATGAWEDDGIVQRALRALRPRFPELVLLGDVCLCEYTSHGHCGVIVDGEVDNDSSLELLARTHPRETPPRLSRALPGGRRGRPPVGAPAAAPTSPRRSCARRSGSARST